MFCLKCGKSIPDHSSFCMFCGITIPQTSQEPLQQEVSPLPAAPVTSPTSSPFGDAEESLDLPLPPETFVVHVPDEDETLESFPPPPLQEDFLFSGIPAVDTVRRCTLCNKELTASNTTGFCVTCTNNRSFLPKSGGEPFQLDLDLDAEYPSDYGNVQEETLADTKKSKKKRPIKEKKQIRLFPIVLAATITLALALFTAFYINGGLEFVSPSKNGQTSTAQERAVVSYAQKMVKEKAANPSSVHFDARSLSISKKDSLWTITQSFERLAPDGNMVESSYVAALKVDSSGENPQPLMLQVDNNILYDSR